MTRTEAIAFLAGKLAETEQVERDLKRLGHEVTPGFVRFSQPGLRAVIDALSTTPVATT